MIIDGVMASSPIIQVGGNKQATKAKRSIASKPAQPTKQNQPNPTNQPTNKQTNKQTTHHRTNLTNPDQLPPFLRQLPHGHLLEQLQRTLPVLAPCAGGDGDVHTGCIRGRRLRAIVAITSQVVGG